MHTDPRPILIAAATHFYQKGWMVGTAGNPNLVSRFVSGDTLPLPPLEMLKGLGVWEENPRVTMPVFTNHLEVTRIADEIGACFQAIIPQVPALLIRDHGVTVWASSLEGACNYLEVVEYIFRYMVAAGKIGIELC